MSEKSFLVEVSARHVHLTQEDVEKLFGAGKQAHICSGSFPAWAVCM